MISPLSFVVHFSFTPFSLSAIFPYYFSVYFCFCFCFAGIGLGSSPTSSQALPPSTDWPVSAYTSSFSLSSPETDDAGTQFMYNPPLPSHITVDTSLKMDITLSFLLLHPRASTINWATASPFKSLRLIQYDHHLSSLPIKFASHAYFPCGSGVSSSSLCVAWEVGNRGGFVVVFLFLLWLLGVDSTPTKLTYWSVCMK